MLSVGCGATYMRQLQCEAGRCLLLQPVRYGLEFSSIAVAGHISSLTMLDTLAEHLGAPKFSHLMSSHSHLAHSAG